MTNEQLKTIFALVLDILNRCATIEEAKEAIKKYAKI